ncbi:MAG: hypothetical protein WCI73_18825 [Phycisphaerae bacterium]
MLVPTSGQTPKLGCTPMLILLFLITIAVGGGFIWLFWYVMRELK